MYKRGESASVDCETVVHFQDTRQFASFIIDGTVYDYWYKIRHTYALRVIFLISFSQNRSTSRPRHCFLHSCLLLTHEQALIETRPGYYYCTRDVRNARARSSRTHPSREVGFPQRKHSLMFLLWKSIRSPASTASRASRCLLLRRKLK